MASKSTHVFKTVGDLELKIELYTRSSASRTGTFDRKNPVVLFLHGVISYSRLATISADYRLLPQVKGADIMEDVKDAYVFVRENLPTILAGRELSPEEAGPIENIILVGQSAGAYLSYAGGLYLEPRPLAILTYYGLATVDEPYLNKGSNHRSTPVTLDQVENFLKEPVNTNMTPDFNVFNETCLLPDLSRNPAYVRPEVNFDNPADGRMILLRWAIQEDGLLKWFDGVEKSLDDPAWKDSPPTFMVHGDRDEAAPYSGSTKLLEVFGPNSKLFTAEGHGHSFDQPFYLGDEGLVAVEEAWAALEEVVRANAK